MPLTVQPVGFRMGQVGQNLITIRRDPSTAYVQFFENVPESGNPTFQILSGLLGSFNYATGAANDLFTLDLTYGNPLPAAGANIIPGDGFDSLVITGMPVSESLSLGGSTVFFPADGNGVLTCPTLELLTVNTGGGNDVIALTSPLSYMLSINAGVGSTSVQLDAPTSTAIPLESLTLAASLSLPAGRGLFVGGEISCHRGRRFVGPGR